MITQKEELRKSIMAWYDADEKDNEYDSVDDFLIDWVDTLIEETLADGSNWNDEIEFIVLNCNFKIKGVRVCKGKKGITYMATIDLPKDNGKTNQVSCGTYSTIIEAIKARRMAEEVRKPKKSDVITSVILNAIQKVLKQSVYDFENWWKDDFETEYAFDSKEELDFFSENDLDSVKSDWAQRIAVHFASKVYETLGIQTSVTTYHNTRLVEEIYELVKDELRKKIS